MKFTPLVSISFRPIADIREVSIVRCKGTGTAGSAGLDRVPGLSRLFEATKVVNVGNPQPAKNLDRLPGTAAGAAIKDYGSSLVPLELWRDPLLRCLSPDGCQGQVQSRPKLAGFGKLACLAHVHRNTAGRDESLC